MAKVAKQVQSKKADKVANQEASKKRSHKEDESTDESSDESNENISTPNIKKRKLSWLSENFKRLVEQFIDECVVDPVNKGTKIAWNNENRIPLKPCVLAWIVLNNPEQDIYIAEYEQLCNKSKNNNNSKCDGLLTILESKGYEKVYVSNFKSFNGNVYFETDFMEDYARELNKHYSNNQNYLTKLKLLVHKSKEMSNQRVFSKKELPDPE